MNKKTYIFYGASGSGKGTQALLLKEYLEKVDSVRAVLYMETGTALRGIAEKDDYTGRLTKKLMTDGGLMPEFLPIWSWSNFLIHHLTGDEHLILDGLARRKDEAPILDGALKFYQREELEVVILDVSSEWSFKRLTERGRGDDTEESIKRRINWYTSNVEPTIDFFRNNKDYMIHTINGEQSIDEVHREIVSRLRI